MADTRGFKRYAAKLVAQVKDQAYRQVKVEAEAIAQHMRVTAPVRTGNLRDSIRVEEQPAKRRVVIRAGGERTTVPVRKGQSPSYDYALGTEWGTQHESAQPFFYSTWRQDRTEAKRNINEAIKKAARDVAAAAK